MAENIKSQTTAKKQGRKINKMSDLDVLLSRNKMVNPIHLKISKTVNPKNLKDGYLDLDEGSVSVQNNPSEKLGERMEVQFESLNVFKVFCEKFNRFKQSALYLQEAIISRGKTRGGVLNQQDVKKIIDELQSLMDSFEAKLEERENEFKSDYVLPEEKTYKLMCSQNSFIANQFIDLAQKADRIICTLDYLYSKGKLGSLAQGIEVRDNRTGAVIFLLHNYMDSIIHLEEGVRRLRYRRQRDIEAEEKRQQKEQEEAQRQAELQKRMSSQEKAKAKKEKAEMRATAKVYKPDENGHMVLVEEIPEKRTRSKAARIQPQEVSTEKVEQAEAVSDSAVSAEQGASVKVQSDEAKAPADSVEQPQVELVKDETTQPVEVVATKTPVQEEVSQQEVTQPA